MSVIKHNEEEVKLLARLMRAEAESDGQKGMLLVGNVVVNRVLAKCFEYKSKNTLEKVIMQRPGGFEATLFGYFYQAARKQDIKLARRVIKGERFHPATRALWFYASEGDCMAKWYNQWNSGKYKSHCFYAPLQSENCY